MRINILNMNLRNFKGVRNLNIEFGQITNITGDNATGKTTLFDAFTWLLFGKNSEDAKDFNIKTLGADGKPMHRLEHQVEATLDVDGRIMKYSRTFREKWTKKRGSESEEFTGHETEFAIDDVPLSQKEYQSRVDFLLKEDVFKMVTNPLYFNSLKWQDRRLMLERMAGKIDNEQLASGNESFAKLLADIGNESLVDFKKKIAAKKGKIKDVLEHIPARIDELDRSRPEPVDYTELEQEQRAFQTQIQKLTDAIEDSVKANQQQLDTIKAKQLEKLQLESKIQQLKVSAGSAKRQKVSELNGKILEAQSQIKSLQNIVARNEESIQNNKARIEALAKRNDVLRKEWEKKNAEQLTIDEHSLNCPTCKQLLPEDQRNNTKEKLTSNFNQSKNDALGKITYEGNNNKTMIQKLQAENESMEKDNNDVHGVKLDELHEFIKMLQLELESANDMEEQESPELLTLQQQLDGFVIPSLEGNDALDKLRSEKAQLQSELDVINRYLAGQEQAKKVDERLSELHAEEKRLAQELAELERTEFVIAEFSKAKIEAIEAAINGKFKIVKFKMFEQQINGGETEACECMVNGVPYSDVNTAGKIAAGIDIINALTDHYKVSAPIWIDNRESIVRLPECNSQIINLIVSPGAKLHTGVEVPFANQATSLFN